MFLAAVCPSADVPAASGGVLPAGPGGPGCGWGAALLRPPPPQPAHHHEVQILQTILSSEYVLTLLTVVGLHPAAGIGVLMAVSRYRVNRHVRMDSPRA